MAWYCGQKVGIAVVLHAVLSQAKSVQLIQSTDGNSDRLADKGFVEIGPDFPFEGPTVDITQQVDQEWMGFGGALTESAALVFWALPEQERTKLLDLYYGENGLGYTYGRTHINSCDFSPDYYTFDEVDGDFELAHFDTNVTHDQAALIPLIKAVQEAVKKAGHELKLLVAPWSPPGWMKTNGKMLGSDDPCLKDTCKVTWAKYISKWITAYKQQGIPIWAMTPQNEPENNGIWESCVLMVQQELDFIAGELGPVLKDDHPEVKIYLFDHNKDNVLMWADELMSHPGALQYTAGIAFHWYTGDEWENLNEMHRRYPSLSKISSEATYDQSRLAGADIEKGNWDFALGYAHEIIGDLNAGTSMWMDWNIILDKEGGPNKVGNDCDAPMLSDGEKVLVHPQYYAIGHFSKYIPAGSRRLVSSVANAQSHSKEPARPYGVCDSSDGLQATSFSRPDGIVAIIVLNCGDEEISFKLRDGADAVHGSIPGRGIQTYLLDRSDEILINF